MNLDFITEAGLDQSVWQEVWHSCPMNHCSIGGRGKIFSCSTQDDVLAQFVKALHFKADGRGLIPNGVSDVLPAALWP
jgi:hypothetical protein